ncbi:MAG TPA: hypothetical protein VG276_08370 [Actinomycetes bacterium]|jgi:hypothetical protein|nr:hypothetical protein [Actinomycetes bacterium]
MAVRIQLTARRRRATRPENPDVTATISDESCLLECAEAMLAEIDGVLG